MIICFPRILRWVPGGRIIRYSAAAIRAHHIAALTCIVVGGAVGLASAPVWAPATTAPPSAPDAPYASTEPSMPYPDFGAPPAGVVGGFAPAVWGVGGIPSIVPMVSGGLSDADCERGWPDLGRAGGGHVAGVVDRELAPPVNVVTPVPEPAWVLVAPGVLLAFCRRVR